MYDHLGYDENAKVSRAHARWCRAVMMAKSFALVCVGVAVLVYAFH